MTNLATSVAWGTSPTNRFNFAYEHARSGSYMRYKVQIECAPCSGSSYFGYPIYLEISLDGKVLATHTLKDASPKQWSETIGYTTGWLEVSKSSGTTALVIRIYSGSGSSRDVKYSYNLPVIVTASTVSATDANIGRTCSIIISRMSNTLRHTLAYKFAGQTAYTTIVSKTAEAVYAWTVPTSTYSLIPDMPDILCNIKCDTYSGDTLIGSSECWMIASAIQSECAPTISATAADTNAATLPVTGSEKIVVKGVSSLAVNVSAAAKYGASIERITVTCGDNVIDVTEESALIEGASSANVVVKAWDSRGFTTTYTVPGLTMVNYVPIWITPEFTRPEATGDTIRLTVTGGCYEGEIGPSTNTITMRVRIKPKDGEWSDWIALPCSVANGAITAEADYSGYDYNADYTAEVEAADLITKIVKSVPIKRGIPVFWWGEDGFTFNVPIVGKMHAAGGMNVGTSFGVEVYSEPVRIFSGKRIEISATEEIYLNRVKLSDILAKIGMS